MIYSAMLLSRIILMIRHRQASIQQRKSYCQHQSFKKYLILKTLFHIGTMPTMLKDI